MPKFFTLIAVIGILIIFGVAGRFIYDDYSNLREKISAHNNNATVLPVKESTIAGGVVPHHLAAESIIGDFFSNISKTEDPETIVLLSPDHFDSVNLAKEESFMSVSKNTGNFQDVEINSHLLDNLSAENKFEFNDSFIELDHGITNLLPFIKKHFPKTKIVPILIPFETDKEKIKKLTEDINLKLSSNGIVIASVDFSHYLPKSVADFHDVKSARALVNFEEEEFENLEVDCWQCLYVVRSFARQRGKEFSEIIARNNSVDFSEIENGEETTSYISVVFKEGTFRDKKTIESKTVLFVGDIMLDREVENLMAKNGMLYPFRKINRFTNGVDIVFGNLEGPIVKNPPDFPDRSLKFAFSKDTVEGLAFGNFSLLSLANNHILNTGENGQKETREFLEKGNIDSVGDSLKCSQEFLYQKDGIAFLAFNKIYPSACANQEIIDAIKSAKAENPEDFLIVSLHWGNEYRLTSSYRQRQLAYQIIDTGADLIVGHHPHVVQEIEIYKNKLIFYSLGNFIFDQYFSENTQQGLAVGLEIYPDANARKYSSLNGKELVFRLFPIQSELSQPFLMEQKNAKAFLEKLAERSDKSLAEEIKSGIIKVR